MSTRTITVKINHHKQHNNIASFNNNKTSSSNTTAPTVSKQHYNNNKNSHTIQQPNNNKKKLQATDNKNSKNSKNGRTKNNVSRKVATSPINVVSSSEDESSSSSSSASSSSEDERQHQQYAPHPKSFSPKRNYKQQKNNLSFVDQVYAGPTFNNAPAPSALPIPPAFNARGSPINYHPQVVTPSSMTLQQQSLDLMNLIHVVVTPQKVVTAYELEKNNLALSEIQQGLRSMLKIES